MPTNHVYDYRKDPMLSDEERQAIAAEHRTIQGVLMQPAPRDPDALPELSLEGIMIDLRDTMVELIECKAERDALREENEQLRTALEECASMALFAVGETDHDVWSAHLEEIDRVAQAALRGEGGDR